ncbi:uncharacterized protein HMPREF1541_08227 [Cyphellophora europaea CBS 101466]|uniref:Uncharacterized protein n=1 Tax=Cyphellophora europaea (strain CBS 101466) TaxID=1220924 RepID=W2RL76_CYPE1|nr:uncharacterized protein HMPREF1541_08227 [Cyphellophora europaea CBS 101466]ETN37237.1 hypothetical protein HMPREF1541_08227 [Cyphellophora europaea CBS 101466]
MAEDGSNADTDYFTQSETSPKHGEAAMTELMLSEAVDSAQGPLSENDSPSIDSMAVHIGGTRPLEKPNFINQTAKKAVDTSLGIGSAVQDDGPDRALQEATNKLKDVELDQKKQAAEQTGGSTVTPNPTPAKSASAHTGVEVFPMSPDNTEPPESSGIVSSPTQDVLKGASVPGTRRTSNAGSTSTSYNHAALARMPPLRRMSTADSAVTASSRLPLERELSNTFGSVDDVTVYSEATKMRFTEDDRRLEAFVNQNEREGFVKQPADNIPTELDEKLKHGAYSFSCSFGWVGDEEVDLEETPLSRESYIEKLDDAKDGIRFVVRAVINYQSEINSRGHHKFKAQFLSHQNQACIVVLEQLDEIEAHLNDVIQEIQAFGEDDVELKDELKLAYTHALPWIQRTRRLICEAHVFYKLNYVLGRQQKTTKAKRALPTIPAGRPVPNSSLERK